MNATVVDPNSPVGELSGTNQGLSEFAGPYVGEMLGKAQALADTPYQAYGGPLTAGASGLQDQVFREYSQINADLPTAVNTFGGGITAGRTFGFGDAAGQGYSPGFTAGSADLSGMQAGSFTGQAAQQYMNPYLQAALEPQLREASRQAEMQRIADAGRLSRAGAFGGSRQAIMEAEGGRNLGQQLADITGRGYSDAFTQAQQQFNTEQDMRQRIAEVGLDQFNKEQAGLRADEAARRGQFNIEGDRLSQFDERRRTQFNEEQRREIERQEREREQFNEQERRRIAAEEADRRYGLSALRDMRGAGQEQRGIEQEGITADYLQYQQEQQYPYEQLQFMQSMLQGLPITATSRQFVEPGGFQDLSGGLGGLLALLRGT
jgi:hypothetical protein